MDDDDDDDDDMGSPPLVYPPDDGGGGVDVDVDGDGDGDADRPERTITAGQRETNAIIQSHLRKRFSKLSSSRAAVEADHPRAPRRTLARRRDFSRISAAVSTPKPSGPSGGGPRGGHPIDKSHGWWLQFPKAGLG